MIRRMWQRRPLITTLISLTLFLALVFGGLFSLILIRGFARPRAYVDYIAQVNAMNPLPGEDQRAWPLYIEALKAMPAPDEEAWQYEMAPYGTENFERLREIQSAHRAAADFLLEAADREGLGIVLSTEPLPGLAEALGEHVPSPAAGIRSSLSRIEPSLIEADLVSHAGVMRRSVRYLSDEARIALDGENPDRAVQCFEAMLRIPAQSLAHGTLIESLTASAVRAFAVEAIMDALREKPETLDDSHLIRLQSAVVRAGGPLWTDRTDAVERLWFLDSLRSCFADSGRPTMGVIYMIESLGSMNSGGLSVAPPPAPPLPEPIRAGIASFFSSSHDEVVATFDRWTTQRAAWRNVDPWSRGPDPIASELAHHAAFSGLGTDQSMRYLALLFQNSSTFVHSFNRGGASPRHALVALALHRYRLARNR